MKKHTKKDENHSHEDHPTWNDLVSHVHEPSKDKSLAVHLSKCDPCRTQFEELTHLFSLMDETRTANAKAAQEGDVKTATLELLQLVKLLRRTRTERQTHERRLSDVGDTVRRICASLILDSLTPSSALRGVSSTAAPRVLLYETDTCTVTLSLPANPVNEASREVHGQVAPKKGETLPSNGLAFFADANHEATRGNEAPLSAEGSFSLPGIPADAADLVVEFMDERIRMRLPVDLGASD